MADGARRHRAIALACLSIAVAMLGAAYAAVPLYRMFCQITGYNGTTMRASKPSDVVLDRTITVRFDANVGPKLDWRFEPLQPTMDVRIGETALAFYRATNISDKPLVGSATYNVTPVLSGAYFNKIECFCFTEQRLEPGQSIEMPLTFFVDPAFVEDKDVKSVSQITLSYTFYPVAEPVTGVSRKGGSQEYRKGS